MDEGAAGSDYLLRRQALLRTAILLTACHGPEPDEEKVRMRLWKQRDHLFTFLEELAVPATRATTCAQTGQSFVTLISDPMKFQPARGP